MRRVFPNITLTTDLDGSCFPHRNSVGMNTSAFRFMIDGPNGSIRPSTWRQDARQLRCPPNTSGEGRGAHASPQVTEAMPGGHGDKPHGDRPHGDHGDHGIRSVFERRATDIPKMNPGFTQYRSKTIHTSCGTPPKQEKIRALVQKAASLHDRAEYEMVRQEKRRCGTLHLYPHNYHDLIDRIQKDGMVWLPIQWTKNYHGFSHRHLPTVPGDPDSSCYGVIARNLEDAEAFRTASAYQGRNRGEVDHEVIAELLGFPACCAKFFVDKWGAGYYDPVWQSAEATEAQSSLQIGQSKSKATYIPIRCLDIWI